MRAGGFHREMREHLEEMILHHITDGPRLLVESAAPQNTEVFGHRDLHALDVLAIPERLKECVAKTNEQHVAHGPLAQIVIDPEDARFIECPKEDRVEGAGRN